MTREGEEVEREEEEEKVGAINGHDEGRYFLMLRALWRG